MMAKELPWLEGPCAHLGRLRDAGRLPHGLLIHGIPGVGKSQLAAWLGNWLLCEAPDVAAACGRCRGCRLALAGHHPDAYRLAPRGERQLSIGVDAVRELGEFLTLASQYGGSRVAIIEPAETMSAAAANSLLKTLEEPPAGAVLILVTARPEGLPATVRSRCQRIRVPVPERASAVAWLEARSPEAVTLLAPAGGAPLRAQALAAAGAEEQLALLAEDLRGIGQGERSPVAAAGRWQQEPGAELLKRMQYLLYELARARVSGDETHCAVRIPATTLPFASIVRYLNEINLRLRAVEQPLNQLLIAEDALIGWAQACGHDGG